MMDNQENQGDNNLDTGEPKEAHKEVIQTDPDSEYELTEEQQQAVLQMQRMQYEKLEDDVWDPEKSIFGEMDYSTFVSQRLKEVNEQWDKEPLPEDDHRHKMIEFKEDQELTSVYAPQPYPGEESDDKVDNFASEESADKTSQQPDKDDQQSDKKEQPEKENFQPEEEDRRRSDSTAKESDNRHKVSANDDTSNLLPGEPLANGEDKKPKKKNKSLRFTEDQGSGDHNTNSIESTETDDTHNDEINTNNSASIAQDEPASTRNGRFHFDSDSSTEDVESVSGNDHDDSNNTSVTDSKNTKDEKVLIELNGKFELVSVKELQAMGYPLPENMSARESNASETSSQSDSYAYHARASRPKSSVGARTSPRSTPGGKRRAQSASTGRPTTRRQDWDVSHYVSPYALTPEQKEIKERREKIIKERELTEKERKKEEDRRKHEEAESAFQWWLETKEEERRERQSNKEEDKEERKKENEEAFDAWCNAKKDQQKKERLLKNREQKERDDAYFIRSRDECEQAFKKWLRSKRKEQQIMHSHRTRRKYSRSKSAKANNRSLINAEWNGKTN